VIRSLLVVCLVLAAGTRAFAQCHPPHYRMGLIFADDPKAIVASISMSLQDFSPRNLICLAGHLRERYPGRTSMLFTIFDSNKPTHYNIFPVELEHSEGLQKLLDHVHARYFLEASKHRNTLSCCRSGPSQAAAWWRWQGLTARESTCRSRQRPIAFWKWTTGASLLWKILFIQTKHSSEAWRVRLC